MMETQEFILQLWHIWVFVAMFLAGAYVVLTIVQIIIRKHIKEQEEDGRKEEKSIN